MKVLVLYAHPAQQHSRVNTALATVAKGVSDVSFVDLYATYPRLDLNVDVEQQRLLDHDAIVFQFPLMWYSTPPIIKEWQDLVLEYGFAYGHHGEKLKGKLWLSAVTAGTPESGYGPKGHNRFELRELLAPLEATANLCQMPYVPPYTLFAALKSENAANVEKHIAGYRLLLEALRDDTFDLDKACAQQLITGDTIKGLIEGKTT